MTKAMCYGLLSTVSVLAQQRSDTVKCGRVESVQYVTNEQSTVVYQVPNSHRTREKATR